MRYIVWHEARGEGLRGMKAVEQVVQNRARIRKLTICQVVFEKGQFQGVSEKQLRISDKYDEKFLHSYKLSRTMGDVVSKDTEYFYSGSVPSWAYRMEVHSRINNHIFLKGK